MPLGIHRKGLRGMNLLEFLETSGVDFAVRHHKEMYTAQEEAAAADVSGHMFAKTVVAKTDYEHVLLVLPASHRVDMDRLADLLGSKAYLVKEGEMAKLFADCDIGAEPPFGSHYELRTIVDSHLAEQDEIAIRAGKHDEVILLSYEDYARLEEPEVADFAEPE